MDELHLLPAKDIRQQDNYSCGACAYMSALSVFGLYPDRTLEETKKLLGTSPERSTHPLSIVEQARMDGLLVEAGDDMSIDDLRRYWKGGWPVICCVQDYGPAESKKAQFQYGHYLTVIGVYDPYIFVQDSAEENALEGQGSISSDGRDMIRQDVWMENWHDRDADGNKFIRFGIALGTQKIPTFSPKDQTRKNLDYAMHAEAFAFAKYMMFAKRARETDRHDLAKLFTEIANVELSDHFSAESEFVGLVGDNAQNLSNALEGEIEDIDVMYRKFIEQAIDAGEQTVADKLSEIRSDEMKHRDRYMQALSKERERT